jgi:hypothetical protein
MADVGTNARSAPGSPDVAKILQWTLFSLCVLAFAVTVFGYSSYVQKIRSLNQSVDRLQREIRSRDTIIKGQEKTIRANNIRLQQATEKLDRQNSSVAVSAMTIRDLQAANRYCGDVGAIARDLDSKGGSAASDFLNSAHKLEAVLRTCGDATTKFLMPYGEALIARARGDFSESDRKYSEAMQTASEKQVGDYWWMRALEGKAYSSMQLNHYQAAAEALSAIWPIQVRAQGVGKKPESIGKTFVFARLTNIKLMCLQHRSPADVRQELTSARSDLNDAVNGHTDPDRGYYVLDLKYIENDDELFNTCSYANLRAGSKPTKR